MERGGEEASAGRRDAWQITNFADVQARSFRRANAENCRLRQFSKARDP
jgi:hypothetical protein